MGMDTDTVCTTLMVHGFWIQNATLHATERRYDMSDARDFFIIMWIVMQGGSWMMPDAYGNFKALSEVAYMETLESLGVWDE
jgi:hypothetical protein